MKDCMPCNDLQQHMPQTLHDLLRNLAQIQSNKVYMCGWGEYTWQLVSTVVVGDIQAFSVRQEN